ncbi:MAG TPA: hypothetical protein VF503_05720 [Sphingobium sp.]|uniref:hypothetical protein n=1 Tax=Sphingobium sp. TaxID=1912891 RepID=UPI002ECFE988
MQYFLDTEFNGFGGELISLALVPQYGDQEFYTSLPLPDKVHSWVERNVIPYLRHVPVGVDHEMSREEAAAHIANYLEGDRDPVIVADWPEDIAQFCMLLLTGPGEIAPVGAMRFELMRTPGFSTAANSAVPHNALHDARALRTFCGY